MAPPKRHVSSDDEPFQPVGKEVEIEMEYRTYENEEDIPFVATGRELGKGQFGEVDEVKRKGILGVTPYARKEIKMERNADKDLARVLHEARALKILSHQHIIEYIDSYRLKNSLYIIMSPVAPYTLQHVLDPARDDEFDQDWRRDVLKCAPGCLITALNFLDEHQITHGDLKGDNILIHDSKVVLIDFGLTLDVLGAADGDIKLQGGIQQPSSCARDILDLGSIFLDISTALFGFKISDCRDFQRKDFLKYDAQLLRWIWYLWATYYNSPEGCEIAMATCELAFFMLDETPKTRISAPQMIEFVAQRYEVVKNLTCEGCSQGWDMSVEGNPFATFREDRFARFRKGAYPEEAMSQPVPGQWYYAQNKWLQQFVHWKDEADGGGKAGMEKY